MDLWQLLAMPNTPTNPLGYTLLAHREYVIRGGCERRRPGLPGSKVLWAMPKGTWVSEYPHLPLAVVSMGEATVSLVNELTGSMEGGV